MVQRPLLERAGPRCRSTRSGQVGRCGAHRRRPPLAATHPAVSGPGSRPPRPAAPIAGMSCATRVSGNRFLVIATTSRQVRRHGEAGRPGWRCRGRSVEPVRVGAAKLKVDFGVEDSSARVARAVRAAVGPDVGLMVDANHAYDTVAAIRLGRRIEGLGCRLVRGSRCGRRYLAGYREVKAALAIPLAGGECREFTRFGFRGDLGIARRWTSCSRTPARRAASSECKKIADMAAAFGGSGTSRTRWGHGGGARRGPASCWRCCPRTRRARSPRSSRCSSSTGREHALRQALLREPIEHAGGIGQGARGPGARDRGRPRRPWPGSRPGPSDARTGAAAMGRARPYRRAGGRSEAPRVEPASGERGEGPRGARAQAATTISNVPASAPPSISGASRSATVTRPRSSGLSPP